MTKPHALVHVHRLDRDSDGDGISDREEGVPQWRVPNNEVKPLTPIDSDGDGIPGSTMMTLYVCVRVCVCVQMWCVLDTLTAVICPHAHSAYVHAYMCIYTHIPTWHMLVVNRLSRPWHDICRFSFRNTGSIPFMAACFDVSPAKHPNTDTQIIFGAVAWRTGGNISFLGCWCGISQLVLRRVCFADVMEGEGDADGDGVPNKYDLDSGDLTRQPHCKFCEQSVCSCMCAWGARTIATECMNT